MNEFLINNSFKIGSIEIRYYAICIVSGFLACALFGIPLFKKRGFKPDILLDLLIAVIPCSIICARLWYVLFDLDEYIVDGVFRFDLAIAIWNGGQAIHGGVCGGALGLFIVAKIKKVQFSRFGDIGAALLPIGQAVGRLGNFFNQEVYGAVVPADKAWFPYATFIEADGNWHVALCFHEMFFNFLAFAAIYIFLYNYKGKRNGYAMAFYFIYYGLVRACMEPMREQEYNMGNGFLNMPTMFWLSLIILAGGIAFLTVLLVKDIKEKNYWWKDMFKKKVPADGPADGEAAAVADTPVDTPAQADAGEKTSEDEEK